MDKEFWHQRWQNRQIGFHQDDINPYLIKYWPQKTEQLQRVLVPLCGKSADMLWLAEQGYDVLGVELSQLAVEEFFDDNKLKYDVKQIEHFSVYSTEQITIYQGDFFELTAILSGEFDYVYDRASQIALPREMRDRYCQHLCNIAAKATIILITMEYDQSQMNGPPFSVLEEEIEQHYASKYAINRLEVFDLLVVSPDFKQRGLDSLLEKVYRLTPL